MENQFCHNNPMDQLLQSIRQQLSLLLSENSSLPASEQLDLHVFSLDEAARAESLRTAERHVSREKELRERKSEETRLAIKTVLQQCWHRMSVKPRAIKYLRHQERRPDEPQLVRNFPLTPEKEDMQRELARHELVLSVTRLITFKPWQTMTESELEQRLNASPLDRRSFKSVAEGVQRLLGELSRAQSRLSNMPDDVNPEDDVERTVLMGSVSHRVLSPDLSHALSLVMSCQIELNVGCDEAVKHSFLLLAVIRDLKQNFNSDFEHVWHIKDQQIHKMQHILHTLKTINHALSEDTPKLLPLPRWDSTEDPELVVQYQAGACVKTGDDRLVDQQNYGEVNNRTTLLQDRAQLNAELEECLQRVDTALEKLARRRVEVETAVRQEELKVARVKVWSLSKSAAVAHQDKLREDLLSCEESVERICAERVQLVSKCEEARRHHDSLVNHDRQQGQGFRREFTHLSPMVVDQLSKWYKRRPAVQLTVEQLRVLSEKLGGKGEHAVTKSDRCEPWRAYVMALRALDSASCTTVDSLTWAMLCRLRRSKTEAEIRVRASAADVVEAEAALANLDACLASQRRRCKSIAAELERAVNDKRKFLLDTEVQVLLPRGRIELPSVATLEDCQNATLAPLALLRALNSDIREAGARKLSVLRNTLRFRAGRMRQAEWAVRKTETEAVWLQQELAHLHKITITSEIRQFLQGTKLKKVTARRKAYAESLYKRQVGNLNLEIATVQRENEQNERDICSVLADIAATEQQVEQLRQTKPHRQQDGHQQRWRAEESRLRRAIKTENEQIQKLRQELEKMKLRTFPTLFDVSF